MNKTITLSIPHRLTQDEARTRIQNGLTEMRTKYAGNIANVQETWSGNQMDFRLTVAGQSVAGRVDVLADAVKLDIELPWLVAMLAEKFRPRIEQEGRKMLEKK